MVTALTARDREPGCVRARAHGGRARAAADIDVDCAPVFTGCHTVPAPEGLIRGARTRSA
ncbi:hypothetical protein JCM33774_81710 [Actinophytocola sp. KF-1]